jgi:urate oxidase
VKVLRGHDGYHEIQQFNVEILLQGFDMSDVFINGNNSKVIATDTCKNTVYCLAQANEFNSIEEFGIIICKHFLTEYPTIVRSLNVHIIQDKWERIVSPNTKRLTHSDGNISQHNHAFKRIGPHKRFTDVQGEKRIETSQVIEKKIDSDFSFTIHSGFFVINIFITFYQH